MINSSRPHHTEHTLIYTTDAYKQDGAVCNLADELDTRVPSGSLAGNPASAARAPLRIRSLYLRRAAATRSAPRPMDRTTATSRMCVCMSQIPHAVRCQA